MIGHWPTDGYQHEDSKVSQEMQRVLCDYCVRYIMFACSARATACS
jgi:hypothetical protein